MSQKANAIIIYCVAYSIAGLIASLGLKYTFTNDSELLNLFYADLVASFTIFAICIYYNNISIYDPKVFKFISSLNKTYTQLDCMQFCYEHLVSKKCKCSNVPQENHMKACILNDEIDCLNRLYKRVMINKEENECLILCPLECSHASFRFSSSFSKYPTLAYSSFLMNNH